MKTDKAIFAFLLILLAILFRTALHVGENVEFVTTATLISSLYLGKKWAILVPLITLLISDAIIGNTSIFLFTWSAYLFLGMVSYCGYRLRKIKSLPKIFASLGFAISGSLWFFLWTNFGVWLLDTHHMYEKDMAGLLKSYVMGVPFFKNNLVGNLFFIFISISAVEFIIKAKSSKFRFSLFNIKKNN
ncbi:hypothetical protein A3D77_04985 [Candidatus Gottesmanbacteria bacterium RIFCSPHIGHO2_02_FULL_39_11]|uniref:Rod shape-determining protein MreD n=1 Tax=Candidatus Gottesmanbacteria bacterium RIFCSPHIGHO2_02_FULL_39_11 TaxID=1798382 RepID=A0A1F5ZMU8_9BACT|nr:MAG: hypothetical protein A3D77_04985 [Candidatus Gottesmanbacteria bacterium RIFCSPHIGHO2_02_FULL_39_11]